MATWARVPAWEEGSKEVGRVAGPEDGGGIGGENGARTDYSTSGYGRSIVEVHLCPGLRVAKISGELRFIEMV